MQLLPTLTDFLRETFVAFSHHLWGRQRGEGRQSLCRDGVDGFDSQRCDCLSGHVVGVFTKRSSKHTPHGAQRHCARCCARHAGWGWRRRWTRRAWSGACPLARVPHPLNHAAGGIECARVVETVVKRDCHGEPSRRHFASRLAPRPASRRRCEGRRAVLCEHVLGVPVLPLPAHVAIGVCSCCTR
jgi:hypothetical protein